MTTIDRKKSLSRLMTAMFFGSCSSVCLTPFVMVTILRDFDASTMQITLIAAIVQIGGSLGLPIALVAGNINPKTATMLLISIGRSSILALILVLLWPSVPDNLVCHGVLAGYLLLAVFGSSAGAPASSWLKQVIPTRIHASFMGRRMALNSIVVAVFTPLIGLFLQYIKNFPNEKRLYYSLFLSIAFIVGFIDLIVLQRVEKTGTEPGAGPKNQLIPQIKKAVRKR